MIYNNLTTDEITQLKAQAGDKATEIIDNLLGGVKEKLDAKLDSEDSGKFLKIDEDGTVTPATLPTEPAELPDAPSESGTYTLKCTVADGEATYSWVADEE